MNMNKILEIKESERVGLKVRNLTATVLTSSQSKWNHIKAPFMSQLWKKNPAATDTESIHANTILSDVSFDLGEGEILAIMGGSGSGKTTLLNILSQRVNITNKNLRFNGSIDFINSSQPHLDVVKNAYLLQTDLFLPGLTVFETLSYQAGLRLPSTSKEDKLLLINSLLAILGLESVRDEKITSFKDIHQTNLSGGEQRRVSLAIQLLAKPSILFLDEPTTGLDSSNAYKLVQTIKTLTSFGMTIVLSIHQPRIEIMNLFDKICLLSRGGRLVYYGKIAEAFGYFESIGFTAPTGSDTNIIDYLMDLSIKDSRSAAKELETITRVNELVANWKSVSSKTLSFDVGNESTKENFLRNVKLFKRADGNLSLFNEIIVLTKRSFLLTYRDTHSLLALNGGSVLLGIILGWMFYKPKSDVAGIRSTISSLYSFIEVIGFSPLFFELDRLWTIDGKFFLRERSENLVSITGFLVSRRIAKFVLEDISVPVIFSCITYFMWGLRSDSASFFFIFVAVAILINLIGMASAMLCFAVAKDFPISGLVMNVYYQLQNSACGYFVNARTMPVYVRWTKYIASFWYAFGILTSNQLTDWTGDCDSNVESCTQFSGNANLKSLGYPTNWIKLPMCILLAWYVGFYFLAGVTFHYRNFDISMAKSKSNTIGGDDEFISQDVHDSMKVEANNESSWGIDKDSSVDITIENIDLKVVLKGREDNELQLLNDISAKFKANKLNAIMGPSGSGKSTLLNFLAGRLSRRSKYKKSGSILLNNGKVSGKDFASICAYVVQNDNVLIPTLTVRETLFYQASLRLPEISHPHIPNIISGIIKKMGLAECADILIGSETVKGISGGEKRRVSIAVQLLNRPKFLLLDEPTSGLDSSTASYIIELLDELANEGTTVLLTIHQPKSELINLLGNILLLAKGGFVAYDGPPANLSAYLGSIGYPCPQYTNLADHMLDVVSGGSEEGLETFQKQIQELNFRWKAHSLQTTKSLDVIGDSKTEAVDLQFYRRKPLRLRTVLSTITRRQLLSILRSKDIIISRVAQTVVLGGVHSLYFAPLNKIHGSAAVNNRLGLIQEVLNLYYIGLINNVTVYPYERDVFYQEYADKTYGVGVFSMSYLLNELPTEIIPNLIFSTLIVFAIGLPRTPGMFFTMFYASFVSVNCGESLGIILNTIFSHLGLATNVLSSLIIIAIFMGGTMSIHMPSFFKAFNWLNPMKYAVGVTAKLGLNEIYFGCDEGESSCVLETGKAVLHEYELDINYGAYMAGLAACLIIYRLSAIAILYIRMKMFH